MAGIRIRDGSGTLRTVTRIRVHDATNTLRTIQRIRIRDTANVLRTVYTYLSAAASPIAVTGSNTGAASGGAVTSTSTTVTVSGGTAPFNYAWSYVTGDPSIAITSPTAATTTFSATVGAVLKQGTFRCAVTDASGNVVVTNDVEVYLEWFDTR